MPALSLKAVASTLVRKSVGTSAKAKREAGLARGSEKINLRVPDALARGDAFDNPSKSEDAYPRIHASLDRSSTVIRAVTLRDGPELEALAKTHELKTLLKSNKDVAKTGFLVSGYTDSDYAVFAQRYDHFLCLCRGKTIVSFVMAYSSELIQAEKEELNEHIRVKLCPEFVLIKQICTRAEYAGQGYARQLYTELFARVVHMHADSRPIFTVLVERPPNERSLGFHTAMGFENEATYLPGDQIPRLIFSNRYVRDTLLTTTNVGSYEANPFYGAMAMADPNCVGVGICLYSIEPPEGSSGRFHSEVRVVMKWRKPGLQLLYPRIKGATRTPVDVDGDIRAPRYALNKADAEAVQHYAYICKEDPEDVITMQLVLRGGFSATLNLRQFPADTQTLPFRFRMWDSDPDDRCRYFRQQYYVDGTLWQIGVKGKITAVESTFLAVQATLGTDPVAGTSFYQVDVPCVRRTWYYLRTVALPLFFISSLAITSLGIPIDDFADRAAHNSGLLLTAVAFMFIAKEGIPKVEYMTQLDLITNGSLLVTWAMIMFQFASKTVPLTKYQDAFVGIILATLMLAFLAWKMVTLVLAHEFTIRSSPELGSDKALFDSVAKKRLGLGH